MERLVLAVKKRGVAESVTVGVLFLGVLLTYILLSFQNAGGSLMWLTRPIGGVTAAWAVYALFRFKLFPARVYPELWLYGAYIAVACVSGLFTAPDRAMHMDMAFRLAQGFAMVVSVYALVGVCRSARPILWILLFGAWAYAVYGLTVGFYYYRVFRQTLGNLNANIFARVPMLGFLACLGLMNGYRGAKRLAFLPMLAGCAYMLMISGSRTAFLACGAGTALYIALTIPRDDLRAFYKKGLLPAALALSVGGFVWLWVRDPYQIKSLFTRFTMLFSDGNESTSLRLTSIREALSQFASHPVFGIGAYQFSGISANGLNHAHCDIAELLMSFGAVGTALYAACCFYGGRGIVRAIRREGLKTPPAGSAYVAMASLFFCYIVMGLGDITIYEMNCQLVLGALTACGMLNRLAGKTP